MSIRFTLHPATRKALLQRYRDARALGELRLAKRIEALLCLAEGDSLEEVSNHLIQDGARYHTSCPLRPNLVV